MSNADKLHEFSSATVDALGADQVHERHVGISRVIGMQMGERLLELGSNGEIYWVEMDLAMDGFPRDTAILHAPSGTHGRRSLEDTYAPPISPTGHEAFDTVFVISGSEAGEVAELLAAPIRARLLDAKSLRPEVRTFKISTLKRCLHLHAQPELGHHSQVAMGRDRFTAEHAAEVIKTCVAIAGQLEAGWRSRASAG